MKANSLCHRGVRAANGHLITPPRSGNELAPFQLIELHSMPTSLSLHDIELAGTSQRVE